MQESGRIGLQEAIAALRAELIESIIAAKDERLKFDVGEITMEFQVEMERNTDGKAGINFWVVDLGAGGAIKSKNVHKVVIPVKPLRMDGESVLIGSDDVPE